jgi:DMSO/TMAO reductase YedYZ heme-binding membrane subunit
MIKGKIIFLIICLILFLELVISTLTYNYEDIAQFGIRVTGLIGFASLFVSIIMSNFFEEYREKNKKNLLSHHLFSIIGIVLITIHPIIFALNKSDIGVFLPKFDSWEVFWELAGRPALILLYIGFVSGILYKVYKRSWKALHMITYIALFFGLIHAFLLGTDFQNPYIAFIFVILFLIMVYVLIDKRLKPKAEF